MGELLGKTPWAIRSLLLIIVIGSNGCTCMPSESDAREYYVTHKQAIDDIESGVRAAIAELPRFSREPPACPAANPADDPIQAMVAETACINTRTEWLEGALAAEQQFQHEFVPSLMEDEKLVGLQVLLESTRPNLFFPGDAPHSLMIDEGNHHANKADSVLPQDGVNIDGRLIGWGLGQTVCQIHDGTQYQSYGDSDYHKQLDVDWVTVEGDTRLTFSVHFLAEDIPTDAWREHCLLPRAPTRGE